MKKSSMGTYIKWQVLVSAALVVGTRVLATEPTALNFEGKPGELLSNDQNARVQAGDLLTRHYAHVGKQLASVLADAVKTNLLDDRYMSPLHCAIEAVTQWRVFESENTLIEIVDYELDSMSIPTGINVPGSSFYPAASALVALKINPKRVADLIAQTKDERRRQLLTWVLRSRVSSTEEANNLLKAAGGNENVKSALEHLKLAPNIPALLPALKSPGQRGKGPPTIARPAEVK